MNADVASAAQLSVPQSDSETDLLSKVGTNDFLTLKTLASPSFNPQEIVLLAESDVLASPDSSVNPDAGTVEFVSYAPKEIVLKATASAPSVLLLNDKFDSNWEVAVSGKPVKLLRANYLMRGVHVPAGEHRVEFRFKPPVQALYVSLSAILMAAGLVIWLLLRNRVADSGQAPAQEPRRGRNKPLPGGATE
jgi:hypothetical protein